MRNPDAINVTNVTGLAEMVMRQLHNLSEHNSSGGYPGQQHGKYTDSSTAALCLLLPIAVVIGVIAIQLLRDKSRNPCSSLFRKSNALMAGNNSSINSDYSTIPPYV